MGKLQWDSPRLGVLLVGSLAFLAVFTPIVACGSRGTPAAADVKVRILKATDPLVGPPDPSMTKEKIVASLVEMLDLVVELAPDNQYKGEIKSRIDVGKELITTRSIFDEKARQYLSFAYRMMTDGKKFEPPKELDQFVTGAELQVKIQRYAKDLVAKSIQALEAGRPGETAKLLLEMVLMVMTPVKG